MLKLKKRAVKRIELQISWAGDCSEKGKSSCFEYCPGNNRDR